MQHRCQHRPPDSLHRQQHQVLSPSQIPLLRPCLCLDITPLQAQSAVHTPLVVVTLLAPCQHTQGEAATPAAVTCQLTTPLAVLVLVLLVLQVVSQSCLL